MFEQAYKDTLYFCFDVGTDLIARAHVLAQQGSADTANMAKLATQAVHLLRGNADAEKDEQTTEECSVLRLVICGSSGEMNVVFDKEGVQWDELCIFAKPVYTL